MNQLTKKVISLAFLLMFTWSFQFQEAKSQTLDIEQLATTYKNADKLFDKGDYLKATALYVKVIETDPENSLAWFKAGICYLNNFYPSRGLTYIKKSREIDANVNKYFYFWLGRAYHLNFKIDSALINYRKFLALEGRGSSYFKSQANRFVEQAHRGRSSFVTAQGGAPFRVDNIGNAINSEYTESNPIFSKDGNTMFFTTRRPNSLQEKALEDGEYREKVYFSFKRIDGT